MSVDILDRVYDAYSGEMGQQFMRETQRRIHWMCAAARGTRIVDVGCSQGVVPILLGREGKEVLGIDASAQSIKTAEEHLSREPVGVRKLVTFVEADFTRHAFNGERFDCVMMGEVLEHLLEPERFIELAAKLLEPGGRLIVTVPFGVNDHVDHKHTFYLRGPYRLMARDFDVVEVVVLGKWLGLVGIRRAEPSALQETWTDALVAELETAFHRSERQLVDDLAATRTRLDDANTKYRSSTDDVARLKREVSHHEAERKQAEKASAQLEGERTSRLDREILLARFEERLNHAAQLRQLEIETRDSEIARLNQVKQQLGAELAQARADLLQSRSERAQLSAELATTAREAQAAASRAETERQELTRAVTSLEARLTTAGEEQARLTAALAEREQQLVAATAALAQERQQWASARETWQAEATSWATEREQLAQAEARLLATLGERERQVVTLTAELEQLSAQRAQLSAEREQIQTEIRELRAFEARASLMEIEQMRAAQALRRERDRAESELSALKQDGERVLETQRGLLRDAEGRLAQSRRDLEESRRAERRAKAELSTERRERNAAERRVAQTKNTLSFQLGYELIHGFKSKNALFSLPRSLWHLNQEAARRRREKENKHQVPLRSATPAVAPVASPTAALRSNHEAYKSKDSQVAEWPAAPGSAPEPPVALPSAPAPAPRPPKKPAPQSLRALKMACIYDDFTLAAFAPEAELLQLTPGAWRAELEAFRPELLFVESAWRGKGDQWARKVAHRSAELAGIVEWCNREGVPTAFWNKEDPVHFRTFLNTAKLFDFVFTTDIDCVARYKRALGHDRVHLLPFAVQPKAHNPIEKYPRKDAIAFAGAYYARYPERQADLESFALHMESSPRLEIYDRNFGKTDPDYQFPERYRPLIVGTLAFDEIDRAYKGYRYALNLNSIKASQSMFARRVFELLACNTITVSNFSRGVRLLFGDLVIATDSGAQAVARLESLSRDESQARRFRLAGLRKVLTEHTYESRLRFVATQVWGKELPDSRPRIAVLSRATSRLEAERIVHSFERQNWAKKQLILVIADGLELQALGLRDSIQLVTWSEASTGNLRAFAGNATHVALFAPGDHYGASYLTDLALATSYSDAPVIGKLARYRRHGDGAATLEHDGTQYRPASGLMARAALCQLAALGDEPLARLLESFEQSALPGAALAIDEFNYCEGGAELPAAALAQLDDLTSLDTGLGLERLLESVATTEPAPNAGGEPQISAARLAQVFRPARGKPVTVTLEGEHLAIHSALPDETHEYIYASEAWPPGDLGLPGAGRLHVSSTPGLNVQLAVLFLDQNKNRLAHKLCQPGANEVLSPPDGTHAVQLGLRVYGPGTAKLGGVLLDHVHDVPPAIFGRGDYLLVTNRYPAQHDLYRNAFVHRRVLEYRKQGCNVDVFRMQPAQKLGYHEFEGVDVISGGAAALQALLRATPYKAILLHFLEPAMWDAIAPYTGDKRVLIWAHGAEIQAWHRRKSHFGTPAQLEAAQAQAEPRRQFWRDVATNLGQDSKLIFVSSHFASEVMSDLGVTLPSERHTVIHNVIDTDLFRYEPKPSAQRKRVLSIRPHTSRIYGNDLAVAAILELSRKPFFHELDVHLVGDGPLFDETVAPLRALPNVRLEKRFLTQTEIANLHREYGIFLCPSRGDTQGVSRDEAMSSGLVPVTSRVGAIHEFVDDDCGFLAAPEDAAALAESIARLYQDPDLFSRLSENAAARVRRQSGPSQTTAREIALIRGEG